MSDHERASVHPGAVGYALSTGGRLSIRVARMKRADAFQALLDEAARSGEITRSETDSLAVIRLIARWGIVGADEKVVDEDGRPVAFERAVDEAHPELGPIATGAFLEQALTYAELPRIANVTIGANAVTEAQGKS